MSSKESKTTRYLPTRTELSEFVEELSEFERAGRAWELNKNNQNALRRQPTILEGRRFSSDDELRAAWAAIQKLPAHQKLSMDPNFAYAMTSFQEAITPSLVDKARFMATVAFYINRYIVETNRPELVKHPDKRTRDQVAACAHKLRRAARVGARLESIRDQSQLETLLSRLESLMNKKPPRQDEAYIQRRFVKQLASEFLSWFGQTLPTVLGHLAAVIDDRLNQRTIERLVSKVQQEHKRKRLAEVMAGAPPH